ncbi:uncharacterized protein LOC117111144 [Anneissia japonica]|uniref:uncharacterized protein LOC117111144 n=1 Tax=Anneissia japonica TaxID=1529436 RepID=UPI0014258456|nr:uncharacterized protein LOC117111144 [Anneissia japonica]
MDWTFRFTVLVATCAILCCRMACQASTHDKTMPSSEVGVVRSRRQVKSGKPNAALRHITSGRGKFLMRMRRNAAIQPKIVPIPQQNATTHSTNQTNGLGMFVQQIFKRVSSANAASSGAINPDDVNLQQVDSGDTAQKPISELLRKFYKNDQENQSNVLEKKMTTAIGSAEYFTKSTTMVTFAPPTRGDDLSTDKKYYERYLEKLNAYFN